MRKTPINFTSQETASVARQIVRNKFFLKTAVACVEYHNPEVETPYDKFIRCMDNVENYATDDNVSWRDDKVNRKAIVDFMFDLHS